MDAIDTIAWLRPDGRLVHTVPAEMPQDGTGLWVYRPRDAARAPVLILLAPQPGGAIRISVAEVERGTGGPMGLHVHRQLRGPHPPPFAQLPGQTLSSAGVAEALAAAMAWADRQPTP